MVLPGGDQAAIGELLKVVDSAAPIAANAKCLLRAKRTGLNAEVLF